MLPDWFDFDALRLTVSTSVVVLALGALAALVFIRRVVARVLVLLVLGGLAGGGVFYASRLDDCKARCDCKFLFDHIRVDDCIEPASHSK